MKIYLYLFFLLSNILFSQTKNNTGNLNENAWYNDIIIQKKLVKVEN